MLAVGTVLAAMVAGVLVFSLVVSRPHGPARAEATAGTIRLIGSSEDLPGQQFTITGSATGLYPGATKSLPLTIHNPYHFAIYVKSITVTAGNASLSCPASNLVTSNFTGNRRVPRMGERTVVVPIQMVSGAPDACQDATFPLTYSGTATKRIT